jgi:hypothetical protein
MSSSKSRSYQTQKTCRSKTAYPVPPDPYTLAELTVAYVHRLANEAVHTAASGAARIVSVTILTGFGGLDGDGQAMFIADATEIVADVAGDATLPPRTFVVVAEAKQAGWGTAGVSMV